MSRKSNCQAVLKPHLQLNKIFIIFVVAFCCSILFAYASNDLNYDDQQSENDDINITKINGVNITASDLLIDNIDSTVTFKGDVKFKYNEFFVKGDLLRIYYSDNISNMISARIYNNDKKQYKKNIDTKQNNVFNDIKSIEIFNASIIDGKNLDIRADKLNYILSNSLVKLHGNVIIKNNDNIIKLDNMEYRFDINQFVKNK